MGELYEICQRLTREVETRYPDPIEQIRIKGQLIASAGFVVHLVQPRDADDPMKIAAVNDAAREVGITL